MPAPHHSAGPRVALFTTCFNDTMWPGTPIATVRVLERLGATVEFPREQTCCGQMFVNTGYAGRALPLVRKFVDVFEGYEAVVVPSGSCVGSIRDQHHYVAQRAGDTQLAERGGGTGAAGLRPVRVHRRRARGDRRRGVLPHRVTFHATCHSLRMAHVGDRPQRLLAEVKGITVVDLPGHGECCGFGGTFSVKNPDVSIAMGADKVRHVRETGAEVLVAGDNSCLAHIGGLLSRQRAGVRTMHLAEVLASTQEEPA